MLLVVLGAGASASAIDNAPADAMPPLTKDLFNERYSRLILAEFPEALSLVQGLRDAVAGKYPIETELAARRDAAANFPRDRIGLRAVLFYLRSVLNQASEAGNSLGFNRYLSLVDKLEHWGRTTGTPIVYVTFNYDTLLEGAIVHSLGHRIHDFADYWGDDLRLVKLHGSVDWAHPGAWVAPADQADLRAAMIRGEGEGEIRTDFVMAPGLAVATQPEDRPEGSRVRQLWPAIAIPVQTGKTFECPDWLLEKLQESLRSVTKILTIGWSGAEPHFLDLLTEYLPATVDTLVVTNSHETALKVFKELRDHQIHRPISRTWTEHLGTHAVEGFASLMSTGSFRLFLDGWPGQ